MPDHPASPSRLARLEARGISRRDFLEVCAIAAGTVGLPATALGAVEKAAGGSARPSVVWLHFQECTGCTESLLRASHPALGEILLDLISLDYHETLLAAAGHQAEAVLDATLTREAGKFVCIVEGAVPLAEGGQFCKIGDRTALELLNKVADKAAAVIAIGSCASFGGIAAAEPNPTGATGVPAVLRNRPVVTLPGCPTNPYNLLGVLLQYATFGTLPALDALGRPLFAFARTIHEDCPRRSHFDAGRFAQKFGDADHRAGHCLYKLGCKGPQTHANCSLLHFCDVVGAWPIGIGHPCVGCTEQGIVFEVPIYKNLEIAKPTAPMAYPAIHPEHGVVSASPVAVGVASAVVGALVGAGVVASKKMSGEGEKGKKE